MDFRFQQDGVELTLYNNFEANIKFGSVFLQIHFSAGQIDVNIFKQFVQDYINGRALRTMRDFVDFKITPKENEL